MKNKCTRMEPVQFRVQFGSLIAPIIARSRFQVQFCEQLGQAIELPIARAQLNKHSDAPYFASKFARYNLKK